MNVIRTATVGLLVALLSTAMLSAADSGKPDLAGTWKLNVKKSRYGGYPAPDSRTELIQQNAVEITFETTQVAQGPTLRATSNFPLDGREVTNRMQGYPLVGSAKWRGQTLIIHSQMTAGTSSVEKEDRYVLSKDGKTLTQTQQVLTGRRVKMVIVFQKAS